MYKFSGFVLPHGARKCYLVVISIMFLWAFPMAASYTEDFLILSDSFRVFVFHLSRSLGLTLLAVAKGRFPLDDLSNGSRDRDSFLHAQDMLLETATGDVSPLGIGGKGANGTNGVESSRAPKEKWNGSGGYWGMINAICDQEPPTPGPSFSGKWIRAVQLFEISSWVYNCDCVLKDVKIFKR